MTPETTIASATVAAYLVTRHIRARIGKDALPFVALGSGLVAGMLLEVATSWPPTWGTLSHAAAQGAAAGMAAMAGRDTLRAAVSRLLPGRAGELASDWLFGPPRARSESVVVSLRPPDDEPPPSGPRPTLAALVLAGSVALGCGPTAQQMQALAADTMAASVNAVTPQLVTIYDKGGQREAARATTRPELEARLQAYEGRWKPLWDALRALRRAHDAWVDALLLGGRPGAALPAVRVAYCGARGAIGELVPDVQLPDVGCAARGSEVLP